MPKALKDVREAEDFSHSQSAEGTEFLVRGLIVATSGCAIAAVVAFGFVAIHVLAR
jgi:hypothetical protein